MPTDPIPISNNQTTPPSTQSLAEVTPSSTISTSPQTPFFPPPGMATSPRSPPHTGALSPSAPGFFSKWASANASLGKSPSGPTQSQRGFDIRTIAHTGTEDDDPSDEHHDSFEFGDIGHLRSRSWNRRTVSMSGSAGSGITSMLSGFEAKSPSGASGRELPSGSNGGMGGAGSTPAGGVMADKVARGQGVLRRLSMSGSSFVKPNFLSPPLNTAPLPSTPSATVPDPMPAVENKEADLRRAATVTGVSGRGRRYSEFTRKRGVSPMGEKILRDHGHF